MKIGVGIPCHTDDRTILKHALGSVQVLKSSHELTWYIDHNDGSEGLQTVVTRVFDTLFARGCDVVLKSSADFYLFRDVLKYIDDKSVVTYAFMKKRPSTLIDIIKFALAPSMWTALYSLPRPVWENIKKVDGFDGTDGSIKDTVLGLGYPVKTVRIPKYLLLRPTKGRRFMAYLPSTKKKIIRLLSRW